MVASAAGEYYCPAQVLACGKVPSEPAVGSTEELQILGLDRHAIALTAAQVHLNYWFRSSESIGAATRTSLQVLVMMMMMSCLKLWSLLE
jgi:hypothetical protein